jgi:hypothetical protein
LARSPCTCCHYITLQLFEDSSARDSASAFLQSQTLSNKVIQWQGRASALLVVITRPAVDRLIAQFILSNDYCMKQGQPHTCVDEDNSWKHSPRMKFQRETSALRIFFFKVSPVKSVSEKIPASHSFLATTEAYSFYMRMLLVYGILSREGYRSSTYVGSCNRYDNDLSR